MLFSEKLLFFDLSKEKDLTTQKQGNQEDSVCPDTQMKKNIEIARAIGCCFL